MRFIGCLEPPPLQHTHLAQDRTLSFNTLPDLQTGFFAAAMTTAALSLQCIPAVLLQYGVQPADQVLSSRHSSATAAFRELFASVSGLAPPPLQHT